MSKEERQKQFLIELRELTIKHGISVGGCGCCGSPYLEMDADVSYEKSGYIHDNGGEIDWITPDDGVYRLYAEEIVLPEPPKESRDE